MISKILQNVYLISNYSNSYIVEFKDNLVIIDAGMDKKAKEILETVEKIGKKPETVLLTHAHLDHINGLAKIKEKYSEIKVFCSKEEIRAVEGKEFILPKGFKGFFYKLLLPLMRYKGVKPEIFSDRYKEFKIIPTPGHTRGSTSFLYENILFCGDLVINKEKLSFPPEEFNENKQMMIKSLENIAKLKFDLLLPGHGNLLEDANRKLKDFISSLYSK